MLSMSLKRAGMVFCTIASLSAPAFGQITDVDNKSAVIFTYFAVGNDDSPSASVTAQQFSEQIDEIASGGYTVKALPDIVKAMAAGKALPDRTIAITFDGADKSVIEQAAPLLERKKLPYTVFIPADRVSTGKPPFMTWNDLRKLKKSGLVTFGLHPSAYARLSDDGDDEIRRQINNSLSALRKELDIKSELFAYPFGEYNDRYKSILKTMGLKAGFGQQSGVAYAGGDIFAMPRFTITERYGDMERFVMTANALPFPVTDVSPSDARLTTLSPSIGFTVPDALSKTLKSVSCFSSSDEKPDIEVLGTRVEIRLIKPLEQSRPRINCTLPATVKAGEDARWRWLGMLYTVPPNLLEQLDKTESITADTDYISSVE